LRLIHYGITGHCGEDAVYGSLTVVLDSGGKVFGLTGLYRDSRKTEKSTVWLGWFGIHPAFRRQGIGSALLLFTINEAQKEGFKTMKIYTSTDANERGAHLLYELFGFQCVHLTSSGIIHYSLNLPSPANKIS